MNLWPFSKKSPLPTQEIKSWEQLTEPQRNVLLEALYKYQLHSGTPTVMLDNPTNYIREGYIGNPDVYSIINRIVRMSSQARLALYKTEKGKWIEVTDHELCKFITNANPTMKMSEFREGHFIYKLAIGNSYWYKPLIDAGVNRGKATELWLMPSNNVQVLGGDTWMNPVGGYNLIRNTTISFKVEEVYHSKFFNPLFGDYGTLYGLSPLKAAIRVISKQNQAVLTELKQFENQSPPYLLYRDTKDSIMGGLSPEQTGQTEELFKDYASKHKSGRPIVLPDKFGMLKLGVSPVDLDILNSNLEGRRILCSIYGIASEMFGDKAKSTYNNMVEAKKDAWQTCLKPNCDEFASDLTSFLINPVLEYQKQGLFFAMDYTDISELQADKAQMVTWMKAAYWTPNEIRDATGVAPFDNPAMNEPWMEMGTSPVSSLSSPVEPLDANPKPLKNLGDYNP